MEIKDLKKYNNIVVMQLCRYSQYHVERRRHEGDLSGVILTVIFYICNMSDDKQSDDNSHAETEKEEQKEGGDAGKTDKVKIDILLKATGNAPIMKKKKWAVDAEKPIGWIMEFVKKYLKLEPEERLFLYVNQTFAPSPDQLIKNLYECFGTDGKLVLHYCKSQAWG